MAQKISVGTLRRLIREELIRSSRGILREAGILDALKAAGTSFINSLKGDDDGDEAMALLNLFKSKGTAVNKLVGEKMSATISAMSKAVMPQLLQLVASAGVKDPAQAQAFAQELFVRALGANSKTLATSTAAIDNAAVKATQAKAKTPAKAEEKPAAGEEAKNPPAQGTAPAAPVKK